MPHKNIVCCVLLLQFFLLLPVMLLPCRSNQSNNLNTDVQGPDALHKYSVSVRKNSDGCSEIYLPKGMYLVDEPIILPSNTILRGDGDETIISPGPLFKGERLITNSGKHNETNISIMNFKVGFEVSAFKPSNAPGIIRFEKLNNLTIENVNMDLVSRMYGIDLSCSIHGALIRGCSIVNTGGGGAVMIRNRCADTVNAVEGIEIFDNTLISIVDEPLAVFGWEGLTRNIKIKNNRVIANTASFGISAFGIDRAQHSGSASNIAIENNRITGSRIGAIGIKGGAKNITVLNNSLQKALHDGIFIDPGGKGLPKPHTINISGNKVLQTGRHGIYASGKTMTIHRNMIDSCNEVGIFLNARTAGTVDITNNAIRSVKRSILVSGKHTGTISGNILNNTLPVLYLK